MSESRKCEVVIDGDAYYGDFIQFGSHVIYDESNRMHDVTRAIVELDNGQVVLVEPNKIRFLK